MRKKGKTARLICTRDIIFEKALLPMEAAVLPAEEKKRYGVLAMVPRAWEAAENEKGQRAKIWVR